MALLVPSSTTSADSKPVNLRPENVQSQNQQPDLVLKVAPDPPVLLIPKNRPLPTIDLKTRPDLSEGILKSEKNQISNNRTQASRPVALLIYISDKKVVEGVIPIIIELKIIAYTFGSLWVGN